MPPAYELLLLNTAIPQIQAAQSGDTYLVPRDIAFSAALTLSAGTANGVPYLNASKVLTTGSALTFDGTNLKVGNATFAPNTNLAGNLLQLKSASGFAYLTMGNGDGANNTGYIGSASGLLTFGSVTDAGVTTEGMRLTSTGLGIGTSSPGFKLQVVGTSQLSLSGAGTQQALQLNNNDTTAGTQAVKLAFSSSSVTKASINAAVYGNDYMTFNVGSDTERMRLDSSGNLGLGQVPAVRKFEINAIPASISQLNGIRMQMDGVATSASEFLLGTDSGGVPYASIRTGNDGNSYMNFLVGSGPTERMRISSDGTFRVKGAGTAGSTDAVQFSGSAPASAMTLDASGNLLVGKTTSNLANAGIEIFGAGYGQFTASGDASLFTNRLASDGDTVKFYRATSLVGSISVTTTATSYNTSSDYRLKNNPQPLTGSGAFIDALQPKTWDWKSGGKGVGFIAHEVQQVCPSSVSGEKDAVDEEGKPIMQAMEYGSAEFIANIIAELQSLRARVAQLEQGA